MLLTKIRFLKCVEGEKDCQKKKETKTETKTKQQEPSKLGDARAGGSHNDMVYVYVPAFWGTFSRNLVERSGVFIRDEGA